MNKLINNISVSFEDCQVVKPQRHQQCAYIQCLSEFRALDSIVNTRDLSQLIRSVSSVTQSCLTLCDPMDCSTLGLPSVTHEFTQTHVHWVGDAIQPSHPLLSPSPPTSNRSQHQGLFQWVSSSHQVAKISEFQLHWSFTSVLPMNTQDWSPLGWTGWISLQSKELSRLFSNTSVQKHQFFCAQLSSQSNSHIRTWPLDLLDTL